MPYRIIAAALILTASLAWAAPPKAVAPNSIPHATALFLAGLSSGGKTKVTFKAAAIGTRFFFEEPPGVSVYVYDGTGYRKETFLKGFTLARALKKYSK